MRPLAFFPLLLGVPLAAAALASCSDFKDTGASASDGGGSTVGADGGAIAVIDDAAGASRDGKPGAEPLPPGRGPGPRGALPSGFCCNADTDCRERHCVDVGGGVKACADECYDSKFCATTVAQLTCAKGADAGPGSRGLCKPAAPGFACVPQSDFRTGTRQLGACCGYKDGVEMGWECEGALCTSLDQNPWVCTQFCESTLDCTGPYTCEAIGNYKMCIPANATYTCN